MKATLENFIGIYENAFSHEFCHEMIKYYDAMASAGYGRSRQQHDGVNKFEKNDTAIFPTEEAMIDMMATRTLTNAFMDTFWKECYEHYAGTYDTLKTVAPHQIYSIKLQKTLVGGGYHVWHSEASARELSQRVLTYVLYLNDVEEGGETEFLYYPKRVKATEGTLVLFPGYFTHTHRGNPPISNTKYILTGWVEF